MDDKALAGISVLLVEDDFYQAEDARSTLEDAGARVLGPYATQVEAQLKLPDELPDCAMLDVNLGGGPDFEFAISLSERGIPVLLVTGYDDAIVPAELSHVRCLTKPARAAQVVEAVRELCR